MGRKIGDGKSVKVTVPENTTIKQGLFYLVGGFLGLAVNGVVTGAGETAQVVLNIEQGEYETSQTNEDELDAMVEGADIFWDNEEEQFTTTPTAIYAGKITLDADENGVIWFNLAPQLTAAADAALVAAQLGDLDDLETEENGSMVEAVNEVLSKTDAELNFTVGDMETLETTEKESLVGAVNEVKGLADDAQEDATEALERVAAYQADSTADDVPGLVADFNALLAKLQAAGLMANE